MLNHIFSLFLPFYYSYSISFTYTYSFPLTYNYTISYSYSYSYSLSHFPFLSFLPTSLPLIFKHHLSHSYSRTHNHILSHSQISLTARLSVFLYLGEGGLIKKSQLVCLKCKSLNNFLYFICGLIHTHSYYTE